MEDLKDRSFEKVFAIFYRGEQSLKSQLLLPSAYQSLFESKKNCFQTSSLRHLLITTSVGDKKLENTKMINSRVPLRFGPVSFPMRETNLIFWLISFLQVGKCRLRHR